MANTSPLTGRPPRRAVPSVAQVQHLASMWDTERNTMDPAVVSSQSSRTVFWRCEKAEDHRWDQSPNSRSGGNGHPTACPFCSNRRVCPSNSLAVLHPEIADDWHPERNIPLTPSDVTAVASRTVWWRCRNGHDWLQSVNYRTKFGYPCPKCRSFAFLHPHVAREWDHERNGDIDPFMLEPGSAKRVWWIAAGCGHRFEQAVKYRCEVAANCQVCNGRQVAPGQSLADLRPDLLVDWDEGANTTAPQDIGPGSGYRATWRCARCRHIWADRVVDRAAGRGCAVCKKRRTRDERSLAALHPELLEEWSGDNPRTPWDVTPGMGVKVRWRCATCSYLWHATVASRARQGTGCPRCARTVKHDRSIAALYPALAREWDERNLLPATHVGASTSVVGMWRCVVCGDTWEERVHARTILGRGCRACARRHRAVTSSIAVKHPEIAAEWDPDANGELHPDDVTPASNKRVWWRCATCAHRWRNSVAHRTSGQGCPACAGRALTEWNSLAAVVPALALEFDPDLNGCTPRDVLGGAGGRWWWRCRANPNHTWLTTIASRLAGTGCPECSVAPRSHQELALAMELATVLSFDLDAHKIRDDYGVMDVDIFVEDHRLVVEFDGSYFHRDKAEQDRAKVRRLEALGLSVIRVREHPLEPLGHHDVSVPQGADVKTVADAVLARAGALIADEVVARDIDLYLAEPGPRAAEDTLRMIDSLLRAKFERARSRD